MCSLCRRNLLAGEQYRRWEPEPGRGARPVCMLCEASAGRTGWTRTDDHAQRVGTSGVRWSVRLVA